jgi:hypothetical protein
LTSACSSLRSQEPESRSQEVLPIATVPGERAVLWRVARDSGSLVIKGEKRLLSEDPVIGFDGTHVGFKHSRDLFEFWQKIVVFA